MWALKGFELYGYLHFANITAALVVAIALTRLQKLEMLLSWAGLTQACFGIAQWFGWNPWNYNFVDLPWAHFKPTGFFGQETFLGAFLVACLAPALFSGRWWCSLPIIFCAWATHSTMTFVGVIAVFTLFLVRELGIYRTLCLSVLGSAALGFWYRAHSSSDWFSDTERFRFWKIGLTSFLTKPIFGHGPASWLPNAPMLEQRLTHLHNEYLEFLTEYGGVGGLIALWGAADFLRKFRLTWHHALVVGLAVDAFGNFPFHIASLGTIFLTGWLLSVRERPVVVSYIS